MGIHVKICGLTNPEDALVAAEAGADLLGMIFYPRSPRCVSPQQARDIVTAVRAAGFHSVRVVAVTVNAPRALLHYLLHHIGVDLIQLHGDEPPAIVAALRGRGYKALRPQADRDVEEGVRAFAALGPPEGPQVLVDAAVPGMYGGTGRTTDWKAAAEIARRVRLLLAGGLTPHNVAEAVRVVRPWGVDVSSGVEVAPGRKDPDKVRAFIAAARHASA